MAFAMTGRVVFAHATVHRQRHSEGREYEVYVGSMRLRATPGPAQWAFSTAYSMACWDLQHFIVLFKPQHACGPCLLFDFQPKDPANPYIALAALFGYGVPGIEVWQTDNNIFSSKSKYARNLLDRFRMQDCKPASTPMETSLKLSAQSDSPPVDETLFRQLVGSLIYLTTTRLDLSFAVSYILRFMTNPKIDHWIAAKRVLHYVHGTSDYGLLYTRSTTPPLNRFTDSDLAGLVDDRKSTSGYVFSIGSAPNTWTSKKQQAHALSSTKAKYRGAVKAACEAVWLCQMLVICIFLKQV